MVTKPRVCKAAVCGQGWKATGFRADWSVSPWTHWTPRSVSPDVPPDGGGGLRVSGPPLPREPACSQSLAFPWRCVQSWWPSWRTREHYSAFQLLAKMEADGAGKYLLLIIWMDELTRLYTLPREPKGHGSPANSGQLGRVPRAQGPLCAGHFHPPWGFSDGPLYFLFPHV